MLGHNTGPAQLPRPPSPWPDHFFSTCNFLHMCNCTWHFELRTCRRRHDIMALSKQVTVIYPVISAKPHQPVSFELDLRIDFTYSVNRNFSLLCPFWVYFNQLFNVRFGRASFASKTYQKPSLWTKIQNFHGGACPQTPYKSHTACVILKVNWPDHSKIHAASSSSAIQRQHI